MGGKLHFHASFGALVNSCTHTNIPSVDAINEAINTAPDTELEDSNHRAKVNKDRLILSPQWLINEWLPLMLEFGKKWKLWYNDDNNNSYLNASCNLLARKKISLKHIRIKFLEKKRHSQIFHKFISHKFISHKLKNECSIPLRMRLKLTSLI